MFVVKYAVLLNLIAAIHCKLEGFIVGGERAAITDFPHSAYLSVICSNRGIRDLSWMCGALVLNQDILLTAAHCLIGCLQKMTILISAGSAKRLRGHMTQAKSHVIHHSYTESTSENDIGLVKMLRRVKFSSQLSRVALMESPQRSQYAQVAGWGLIDEDNIIQTKHLMKLKQVMWRRKACIKLYGEIPESTFCASSNLKDKYVSVGDSGSALVIRDYIQIGIVSLKIPHISKNLIVFTNVSFYYKWIHSHAKNLNCQGVYKG